MYFILINLLTFFIKTKVILHLEQINPYMIHTGISFHNGFKNIRYDYRSFNDGRSYVTTYKLRQDFNMIFPNLAIKIDYLDYQNYQKNIKKYKKDIFLGYSNYNLDEITNFEKFLHKRYILGFYDCRHYTNHFCIWSLNKSIPIWNLQILLKDKIVI